MVVLALLALAVAAAVQLRTEPVRPVLGQLGGSTGMSAAGPPSDGLRVAWAHEPVAHDVSFHGFHGFLRAQVVARGDRIRVGGQVVDLRTGRVVRVAPDAARVGTIDRAVVQDGQLVLLDTLTGAVRGRTALAGAWGSETSRATVRAGDVSLFGDGHDSRLVRDDGAVVATVDGVHVTHLDRAVGEPAAVPLRSADPPDDDHVRSPVRVVAMATGEVVLDLPGTAARVVDVVGDLAMVATSDGSPGRPDDGTPWTVRLLDAGTGEEHHRVAVRATDAPRLLGRFSDGTAVVAARLGRDITVGAITPAGTVSIITKVVTNSVHVADGPWAEESATLDSVAVTGDVVVAVDGDGGVTAFDRSGGRVWHVDTGDIAGLMAGGGHVALVSDLADRAIRIVRAGDGEVVASLRGSGDPLGDPWGDVLGGAIPVGVLDGHVGVGHRPRFTDARLALDGSSSTWLDLRTGGVTTVEDLFAQFAGADEDARPGTWTFHGTVTDDSGAVQPVISRYPGRGVIELLDPRAGFHSFELPLPRTDGPDDRFAEVVGATGTRLAVWGMNRDEPASVGTHVLDRSSGEITTVPGVIGLMLLDDLLLARDLDESFDASAVVGLDPATGDRRWTADPVVRFGGPTTPRIDDRLLVVTSAVDVVAVSLEDGTRSWSHDSDTELTDQVLLGPRTVVVATTDGEVVALDRGDGTVVWRTAVGTPVASITGAGDDVLVGTHDGLVVHLDGRGREVQRVAVGRGPVLAVAALGETVVASVDGAVVGLRPDGTGITHQDEVELP